MLSGLNLNNVVPEVAKVASAYLLSKPVSSSEAAQHLLQLPILLRGEGLAVEHIPSLTPETRLRKFRPTSRGRRLSIPPIDRYTARPQVHEPCTFCDYFRGYLASPRTLDEVTCARNGYTYVGDDSFGKHVCEWATPKLVRFTDPNPVHDVEAYFYSRLLAEISFRREADLLPPPFLGYFHFYMHLRCPDSDNDSCAQFLEAHLLEYSEKHMFDSALTDQIRQLAFTLLETRSNSLPPGRHDARNRNIQYDRIVLS